MPAAPLTRLLSDLVAIPSVNPSGDPGTPHTGEEKIARFLEGWTRRAGAEARLVPVEPGRPNLLAVWKPKGRVATRIWFAPHTDTVSVLGMTVAPFTPTVKNGRLYGRGASDTKGTMAAMLGAVDAWWKGGGKAGNVEVTFAGLMGEEAGNDGARALAKGKEAARADLIIVGEPTGLKVVTAHKGALWFELRARGRACHASIPEQGRNAIEAMGAAIALLRREVIPALALRPDPLLGPATLNVGTIRGGSKVNIVPDSCVAEIDVRTTPGWPPQKVLAAVRAALRKAGLAASVSISLQRTSPGLDTPASHPLVQALARSGRGTGGVPWFCDAAIFAARGLPAVAFGPGSIDQAHTKDEYLRLSDLEAGAAACLRFLRSL